jgi:O-antigen ligase
MPYTQHNVFLAYAVETGLLGLGLFLAMLIAVLWRSYRLATSCPADREFRHLGYFGVAITLTYFLNGMFHDVSIIPMSNCLLLTAAATVGRGAALAAAPLPSIDLNEGPSVTWPLGNACH